MFFFVFCMSVFCVMFFFFFSSRRRHTRWNCDWSSDVCSSDLNVIDGIAGLGLPPRAVNALGLLKQPAADGLRNLVHGGVTKFVQSDAFVDVWRSEEHTSELQSQFHLVCRLLLEKKKNMIRERG